MQLVVWQDSGEASSKVVETQKDKVFSPFARRLEIVQHFCFALCFFDLCLVPYTLIRIDYGISCFNSYSGTQEQRIFVVFTTVEHHIRSYHLCDEKGHYDGCCFFRTFQGRSGQEGISNDCSGNKGTGTADDSAAALY